MKNKKLERIIDYGLDWAPIYGIVHASSDKRLDKNSSDLYLICNSVYHGVTIVIPIVYLFIKR